MSETVLRVSGLKTHFALDDGVVKAVDGVDLEIGRGETLAVVGESGCGKSVMARSILRLVDRPGKITGGEIWVRQPEGMVDLVAADEKTVRTVRGKRVAMVFQEPMTSMSPMHTLGNQIGEAIRLHEGASKAQARERVIELLRRVDIPDPKRRVDEYPFQMSGGMLQRAMIAMALSCSPELLIADEPTTALDVTTQARILELLASLQQDFGMAIMLITHDLGVAAQMADRIAVMYLGSVVERGDTASVFRSPRHPYTRALLRSIPRLGARSNERLKPVRGMVPNTFRRPPGCPFHDRCDEFMAGRCDVTVPQPVAGPEPGREVRCLLYEGDGTARKKDADAGDTDTGQPHEVGHEEREA